MTRNLRLAFMIAVLAVALAPATARAQQNEEHDNYLVGYYARNFGGDLFDHRDATDGVGVALTFWGKGLFSAELDLGYDPDFFGSEEEFGSHNNLLTATLNGIIGPWISAGSHKIRPYGVVGGGLMRTKIEEFKIFGNDTRNTGMIDAGGGVLFLVNGRVGVRGEARYNFGVGANDDEDGWGRIKDWNYLRGSIGVAVAF